MSNVKTVTATPHQILLRLAAVQEALEHLDLNMRHQDACDPGTLAPMWADVRREWKMLETVVGLAIKPQTIHLGDEYEGYEDIPEGLARKLVQEDNEFRKWQDRRKAI